MAPCGCFFDPRIYRIEWATTNVVQPSVYKLASGTTSPTTYLLDSPRYLGSPSQTVPYPPYPSVPSHLQYIMPYFNQEGPSHGTEQVNLVPNPLHNSPFIEMPQPQEERLVEHNDNKPPQLLITLPGVCQSEQPLQTNTSGHLKGRLSPHDPRFQDFDDFRVEGTELRENHVSQTLPVCTLLPDTHTADQILLPSPCVAATQALAEAASHPQQDGIQSDVGKEPDAEEPFDLPEKVLLEDAMKLFDCSPANSDTEVARDALSTPPTSNESKSKDGSFPREDSPSDVRSLNLPDELLSFDYSVPEILTAVASMDYFYDLDTSDEETRWDLGPMLQPPQTDTALQGLRQEPPGNKKPSTAAAKKGKQKESKNKPAVSQGSSASDRQEHPAPSP